MKTTFFFFSSFLLLLVASPLRAQTSGNRPVPPATRLTNHHETQRAFTISERGPHHRVWQRIETLTNAVGRVITNRHSYTELATGLHFRKNGEWVETSEQIDLL